MADLDDFFAKKDRKKSKKKFSTADEIVKKLEDTGKKIDKTIKKERFNQEGDDVGVENVEQDEWKDFEEEKKDYSGLKIGRLTADNVGGLSSIDNQGADAGGVGGDGGSDSGSTSGDGSISQNDANQTKGPWKRFQQTAESVTVSNDQLTVSVSTPATGAATTTTTSTTAGTETKSSGYIAPHLRGNRSQATATVSQGTKTRGKTAPNIHDEKFFPTLSSTTDPINNVWGAKSNKNEGVFEEVRHNKASLGRQAAEQRANQQGNAQLKLNLGNRYNSLSTNDS